MQHIIEILREALSTPLQHDATPCYDAREIRAITDLLIEEVCGITRVDRLLHPTLQPTPSQRAEVQRLAHLLAQGIPVQQALGYEWFCGQKFRVSPHVLIPRPETAELVEWIVSDAARDAACHRGLSILDLGTGSGCIAITLARLINNSQVLALDLSTAALDTARLNASEQGVDNVQFAQCDILKCVDNCYFNSVITRLSTPCTQDSATGCQQALSQGFQQQNTSCQQGRTVVHTPFDIIVSNPPYICRKEAAEMSSLVTEHEPDMALFVPDHDPLLFYRAIARFAQQHLAPQGRLYFEINAAYGSETCQMLQGEGFRQVTLRQDVNGRDRMICAKREK